MTLGQDDAPGYGPGRNSAAAPPPTGKVAT